MKEERRFSEQEIAGLLARLKVASKPSSDLTIHQMLQGDLGEGLKKKKEEEGWSWGDMHQWLASEEIDIGTTDISIYLTSSAG